MKKSDILTNEPVYLAQATLDLSKSVIYEFYNYYTLSIYGSKVILCYMDTDSFFILLKQIFLYVSCK